MFSICETIAGILHPFLGFPNTWKILAGSSAEGQQDYLQRIFKGPFQPKLAYNSVNNSCGGSGSEGIQIFWARIVAKAVVLWKHSPRFSRAGECYLTFAVIDYKTFHSLLQKKLSCCQLWGLYRERWDKRREGRIALLEGLKNQRP